VRVLPGNSVVADKVSRGELLAGITDTDDFYATQKKPGSGIRVVSDAPNPAINAVLVPGSVAILKNAPQHESGAKTGERPARPQHRRRTDARDDRRTIDAAHTTAEQDFYFSVLETAPGDTRLWPESWNKVREPLADILLRD
jgi:hypothetical protein